MLIVCPPLSYHLLLAHLCPSQWPQRPVVVHHNSNKQALSETISCAFECEACDVVLKLLQHRCSMSLLTQSLLGTLVPAVADALLPAPPLKDSAFVQWLALAELTHAAAATAASSRLLLLLPHLILTMNKRVLQHTRQSETLLVKH
jgi:hypothetical protein